MFFIFLIIGIHFQFNRKIVPFIVSFHFLFDGIFIVFAFMCLLLYCFILDFSTSLFISYLFFLCALIFLAEAIAD